MAIHFDYETDIILDLEYTSIITKVIEESLTYVECPYEAEINVILTDNNGIREINHDYRQIDAPTDVLSFPMIEYFKPADFSKLESSIEDYFNPDTGELILGDIIISVEKVVEQTEKYGHSAERELAFLTAHSMLHLFGYDHMEEVQRLVMEGKQEQILANLSITR